MSQTQVQNLVALDVAVGFAPKNGPRTVPALIDFSLGNPFNLDLTFMEQMDKIEFIQTVFVDNSANSGSVTIQTIGTQQKIICPPYFQGYFPILVTEQPKFLISCSSGTPIVPIQFMNVSAPDLIWNSSNTNVIGAVTLAQAATDGSTTITTGGTAQNLFGGTVPTNGYAIYNPDGTNDIWVSDSTTAAVNGVGSIRVPANGGAYVTPDTYKPIGAVSVIGATTGGKITARRW